ncbi:hypothetical protein G7066_08380 [Leucobacter coleopterorum]|uniref:Uncharacterized protein n=1 Tax=Leucobacter coleopterorum TaxID=2714933 RepID=A0ABX6JWK9_9MICO|nr:hypothetical protein [Leucobacter coleopterorum]QIM18632.1 hypothetical protein G7066_08380 [Leucobacter coleopterorum]
MNSEVAMTSDEQVFRRVFRFHPHAWRDENEAVAASVLMDVAEAAGRTQPSAGDKLSVQGHAMSLWLRRVIRPDLAETVASLALGTGFMIALFHLISFEVLPVIQMLRYFSEVEYAPTISLSCGFQFQT